MIYILICIILIIWLILIDIIIIKEIASHYRNVSEFEFLLKILYTNTNITNTMADCYSNR